MDKTKIIVVEANLVVQDMYRDSVPKLKQKIQTFLTPSVEKVAEHNLQIQKKHIRHLHSEIFWKAALKSSKQTVPEKHFKM